MARRKKADKMVEFSKEEAKVLVDDVFKQFHDDLKNQPQRLAKILKRLRENKGLSISDVAKKTTLSASYLYQIERGIRKPPSVNVLVLLSEAYDVPFASLMAAAKYVGPDEKRLYHDRLDMAFKFVCQDKQFKYSRLVDEEAVPEDVKRLVLEMYQHLTGLNLLDHVDDEHAGIRKEINRKRRGENVEPQEIGPNSNAVGDS